MNTSAYLGSDAMEKIADAVKESECLLIGAGAGLSAAAGINYTDQVTFKKIYPQWEAKGHRIQYEFVGVLDWPEEEKWAYYATHIKYVFFDFPPSPLYKKLHDIASVKNFYVITSNADDLFIKSGFEPERVFQAQGNYARLVCTVPCRKTTYDIRPYIDRILGHIDYDTLRVSDPSLLPVCPNCGAPMFIAFRQIEEYEKQADDCEKWLKSAKTKKLLVMEIGVGFNTPGVIRWPFERLVYKHDDALFVRVNSTYKNFRDTAYPQVPEEIKHKSISVNEDAGEFINALYNKLKSKCII